MSAPAPGCSLNADEYADVVAAYRHAATRYTAVAELTDDRATIGLSGPKGPIKDLLDEIIAREGRCCAHLQFEVTETAGGYRVELSVLGVPSPARAALRQAALTFFPTAAIIDA